MEGNDYHEKTKKAISLLVALVLSFSCINPLLNVVQALDGLPEGQEEQIVAEEFYEGDWESAINTKEWYVGDNEELYVGEILAGEEFPEDNMNISPFNLENPDESTDLNISINGITGLMSTRRMLADFLGVTWDTTNKFLIQGGCSDGEYVYIAFHLYTREEEDGKTFYTTTGQKILCAKLIESGENAGQIDTTTAVIKNFSYLDHANSLTYNSKTDQVIVANLFCQQVTTNSNGQKVQNNTDEYYRLTVLNAAFLRGEAGETSEATYKYVPCRVNSIAYDEYEDQYIVGISGKKYSFAILNSEFFLEKVIGYLPDDTEGEPRYDAWARNDICCDESNIYALVSKHLEDGGFVNVLTVFNKKAIDNPEDTDSIVAKEINLNSHINYEAENIFKHGDKFLIGYYKYDGTNNNYGYVDISLANSFNIEYEPNLSNTNNVNGSDSTRKSSQVLRGVSTELMPNTFANTGYKFKGWAAYWVEGNKWYCNINGTRSWKTSFSSADDLYLYADGQKVSKTVPAGHTVVMVAQWETTNKFYVTFLSNDLNNLTSSQQCTHGSSNVLNLCTFTNAHTDVYENESSKVFNGWHAHWVEGDKWYYESADGGTRGWYKEGSEPTGYKKYVYKDGVTVKQTVPKGHNVEMHAFWNEFKVYYFAGAVSVPFEHILTPTVGEPTSNIVRTLENFSSSISSSEQNGSYIYHIESEKWYYQNSSGSSKAWYASGSQPSSYVKHLYTGNTIGNMACAGEGIVMCWNEGTSASFDF